MTNQQIKTLAKFAGLKYRLIMDLLHIEYYGMSAEHSRDFLFDVWIVYRDIDRSKWQHIKEWTYINDRVRIEYAILNEPIEKSLTLLSNSITNLNL